MATCICDVCGEEFDTEKELEEHVDKEHPDEKEETSITCAHCG